WRCCMRSFVRRLWPRVRKPQSRRPARPYRLELEGMEDRFLPSVVSVFHQANLVSDEPDVALIQDPNLVKAWGIALSPTGGACWVSDNGAGVTTLYSGGVAGSPFAQVAGLSVVSIPGGKPTGQVFNSLSTTNPGDFVVRATNPNGVTFSGPALFIFATENG